MSEVMDHTKLYTYMFFLICSALMPQLPELVCPSMFYALALPLHHYSCVLGAIVKEHKDY
jgi:hypothetical protein